MENSLILNTIRSLLIKLIWFRTKNTILDFSLQRTKYFFWWVNSCGHLIVPVNNADPKTFHPFDDICGGIDKNGIYYGCPNYGVYQLNIPIESKFEFISKENNYWNAPNHYVIIDNNIYDIKFDISKGYYCELNKTVSINDIIKVK